MTEHAIDRCRPRFMEVFRRHPGTLLAADESPHVIEGQSAFRGSAESPDYQDIPKARVLQ